MLLCPQCVSISCCSFTCGAEWPEMKHFQSLSGRKVSLDPCARMGMHVGGWTGVLWGCDAHTHTKPTHRLKSNLSWQDDEVVLQCVACIQKENRKFCLAAEGLGNRLCYLEPTSEAKVGPHNSTDTAQFDPDWSEKTFLGPQRRLMFPWDVPAVLLDQKSCAFLFSAVV